MDEKYSDEKIDMHPKSWLSDYRKLSIWYLVKMGIFYTVVGLVIASIVAAIEYLIFDYQEPIYPISLIQMVTAGPIEETFFFGIPYSITGHPYVVLVMGSLWAIIHIFNAQLVEESAYSFSTLGFTIPHIFFSLRTWKSGKGWFTIPFHSAWNVLIFSIAVGIGDVPLVIVDQNTPALDYALVILSVILMGITYPIYRWRLKREFEKKFKN